jgi:hypothetical protein
LTLAAAFHPFSGTVQLELAAHALSVRTREVGDQFPGIVLGERILRLRPPQKAQPPNHPSQSPPIVWMRVSFVI